MLPLEPLYEFIQQYWRLGRGDLVSVPFDLEECFTFIELQRRDAWLRQDEAALAQASKIQSLLTQLLLDVMSDCEHWFRESADFSGIAARIWNEHASVLTFNYDTILESAIEVASSTDESRAQLAMPAGLQETVTDSAVSFRWHNWNRVAAYGVPFDDVMLAVPGTPRMVAGGRYFSHPRNAFSPPRFLKLHGSLGWFTQSGYRIDGARLREPKDGAERQTFYRRTSQRIGAPEMDYGNSEVLLPLIITPVLNKPYDDPFFRNLWSQAGSELRGCRRLVVGGYSFPPTDFQIRRLLREVFRDHGPEELHIINPDTRVVATAKELCNFRKPVSVSASVGEFLAGGA